MGWQAEMAVHGALFTAADRMPAAQRSAAVGGYTGIPACSWRLQPRAEALDAGARSLRFAERPEQVGLWVGGSDPDEPGQYQKTRPTSTCVDGDAGSLNA